MINIKDLLDNPVKYEIGFCVKNCDIDIDVIIVVNSILSNLRKQLEEMLCEQNKGSKNWKDNKDKLSELKTKIKDMKFYVNALDRLQERLLLECPNIPGNISENDIKTYLMSDLSEEDKKEYLRLEAEEEKEQFSNKDEKEEKKES